MGSGGEGRGGGGGEALSDTERENERERQRETETHPTPPKATVGYTEATTIDEADSVLVTPAPNSGVARICKLMRSGEAGGEQDSCHFLYQQVAYVYASESSTFTLLQFPTNDELFSYLLSRGHESRESFEAALLRYGANRFDIPVPEMTEMLTEQVVAPFFVFQVFCCALWCLDEYWIYSVVTHVLLVLLELINCYTRRRQMQKQQELQRPPSAAHAFRFGQWLLVSTESLVPGDIVSVTRAGKHETVGNRWIEGVWRLTL